MSQFYIKSVLHDEILDASKCVCSLFEAQEHSIRGAKKLHKIEKNARFQKVELLKLNRSTENFESRLPENTFLIKISPSTISKQDQTELFYKISKFGENSPIKTKFLKVENFASDPAFCFYLREVTSEFPHLYQYFLLKKYLKRDREKNSDFYHRFIQDSPREFSRFKKWKISDFRDPNRLATGPDSLPSKIGQFLTERKNSSHSNLFFYKIISAWNDQFCLKLKYDPKKYYKPLVLSKTEENCPSQVFVLTPCSANSWHLSQSE